MPDQKSRLSLLKTELSNLSHLSDDDFNNLVIATPGFIASDMKALVREAKCLTFWKNHQNSQTDLLNIKSNDFCNKVDFSAENITLACLFEAAKKIVPSSQKYGYCTIPNVTWDDIGSMDDIKTELKFSVLSSLYHPEVCKALNVTMSSGILLEGPPGCGKTLLAKALANEAGVNFISVKGPELLSMVIVELKKIYFCTFALKFIVIVK